MAKRWMAVLGLLAQQGYCARAQLDQPHSSMTLVTVVGWPEPRVQHAMTDLLRTLAPARPRSLCALARWRSGLARAIAAARYCRRHSRPVCQRSRNDKIHTQVGAIAGPGRLS
jgi:hypothetical protein